MKKCPKCGREYQETTTLCPADGTVLEKDRDALVGQTLAGKYRIEERISQGGMGAVYRATHILMEKTVAIKVLHPALAADEKIVARFTREAKAASRLSHPHAMNVTDFGEDENGIVFLVMEYLRGRTLKEVIRSEGPMPLPRVVEIARQVCGALDAAHAEGVVHRDLKSDNIMLEEVGGSQDWAKVLDFGIAKIKEPLGQDPELTAPNLIIGTPQYMSPEQCSQASEIDARSDIYSMGVILYEMFVGHVPFTGESATAIMLKHLQEPPPSVLEERKDLPPAVGRVVTRAMAKRREDRYQTAGDLVEALSLAALEEPPVEAPVATAEQRASGQDTNRIVVPTAPLNDSRPTANTEHEEATVVRARTVERSRIGEDSRYEMPPPAARFNPWRIAIPAVVLLIVVFGVFYALQRNSGQSATDESTSPPLMSDPNSQPVQPAATPTGESERNIAPNSPAPLISPEAGAASNPNTSNANAATANKNETRNAQDEPASDEPAVTDDKKNRKTDAQQKENKEKAQEKENPPQSKEEDTEEEPEPPTPPNKKGQRPQPTPRTSPPSDVNIEPPALPTPSPKKPQPKLVDTIKPTPKPAPEDNQSPPR